MYFQVKGSEKSPPIYKVFLEENKLGGVDVMVNDGDGVPWFICSVTPKGLILYNGLEDTGLPVDKKGYIKVAPWIRGD